MIDRAEFVRGLVALAVAVRQEIGEDTMSVYHDSLGPQVEADEWDRFIRWAVDIDRFPTWFPKLAELRDALRDFRGERSLEGEAVEAYECALSSGVYTAEGGTSWSHRAVRAKCGSAAADAFLEAGGHHAFANTYREHDRRTRFLAAYIDLAKECPSMRMLAPSRERLLSGAVDSEPQALITAEQARELLAKVQTKAPVPRAPVVVNMDDPVTAARVEALREQARRIMAEQGVEVGEPVRSMPEAG